MATEINLLELILTYHNSLFLFLDILSTDKIHDSEFNDIFKNISCNKNKMTDLYGFTRCYSACKYLNNLLFKNNNAQKKYAYLENNIIYNNIIKDMHNNAYNKVEIVINPDHIFLLYKINGEWYMFSSWIQIYNFNIFKINDIDFFIKKICKYFNDNDKDEDYYNFLQKYFMYKIVNNNNSIYITKDIRTINYKINNINMPDFLKDYSFIIDDYMGTQGKHTIKISLNYISNNDVISNFKKIINNIYNDANNNNDNNIKYNNETKFIKKMITNTTNDADVFISYIFRTKQIDDMLTILLKLKNKRDKEYFGILDGLSLMIDEILYIYDIVNSVHHKLILKNPMYNKDTYQFNNKLILKYGNMLVDNIHKNKYYYGFLTGGEYTFYNSNINSFLIKFKNDNLKREIYSDYVLHDDKLISSKNDIIKIFYNLYNLIGTCYDKNNKKCMDEILNILKNSKDLGIKYSGYTYDKIMQIINQYNDIDSEHIIIIYYNDTPYIYFNRFYTINHYNIRDNKHYNTHMIMYYKYDKLFFIEADYEYILDSIFTNYIPFNNNVYIYTEKNIDIQNNINIVVHKINKGLTVNIHKNIRSYIEKYTNKINYNNSNELFVNIYKKKNENRTFSLSDFIKLNDIINYKKNYDDVDDFYTIKKDFNYNPMLDEQQHSVFDLKNIYLSFRLYNNTFGFFLSKIYEDLHIKKQINNDILIQREKYITHKNLNDICTNVYINLLYKEYNEKITFLLYTYCLIKKLLKSEMKTTHYTYKEEKYNDNDYVFIFKGGMALNILYYENILKYKNEKIKNKLLDFFGESDFDFSIYINTKSNKFNNQDKIAKFKLKLYIILNMIKNKLNLNFIKNKLDYNKLLYNIKYRFDTFYCQKKFNVKSNDSILYEKNVDLNKKYIENNDIYSVDGYKSIFSQKIFSDYNINEYRTYIGRDGMVPHFDNYNIRIKNSNDVYIFAKNNENIKFKNNIFDNKYYLTFNHSLYFDDKNNFDLYRIKLGIVIDSITSKINYVDNNNAHLNLAEKTTEKMYSEVLDISVIDIPFDDNFKNNYIVYDNNELLDNEHIGVDLYNSENFDGDDYDVYDYIDTNFLNKNFLNDDYDVHKYISNDPLNQNKKYQFKKYGGDNNDNDDNNNDDNINDISMDIISTYKNEEIHIISNIYVINDIIDMLFKHIFPWTKLKYNKRLYRLIYIIYKKYNETFKNILYNINFKNKYNDINITIKNIDNNKQNIKSFYDIFDNMIIVEKINNDNDIFLYMTNIYELFKFINNINDINVYITIGCIFKNKYGDDLFKEIFPDIVDCKIYGINDNVYNNEQFNDYKTNHSKFFRNIKNLLDTINNIFNEINSLY
jgi:hypothetical protein